MEKEFSEKSNLSGEIKDLVQFLGRFPELAGVTPEYFQREEYWTTVTNLLRQAVERKELTWDQYDYFQGSLVAAKEWLSDHDTLTGLLNRRAFEREIKVKMTESERYRSPLTLIFIDIDNLKTLNDERGHPVTDQFLQKFGEMIRRTIRTNDVAARIGGDEFAIITPHISQEKAKILIARLDEEVQNFIKETPTFTKLSKPLGVSFVQSQWDKKGTKEEWIKRTDEKLYELKKQKHG